MSDIVKYEEQRKDLISRPEILNKFSEREKMVLASSNSDSISTLKNINEIHLLSQVANLIQFLCRDLGIRKIDEYTSTRIYDIITKYFSDLTLSEIKISFEYLMLGELDEYLPKNSKGEADRNHYQEFSVEFLTKTLNAYKKYKSEITFKLDRILPAKFEISEKQICENDKIIFTKLKNYIREFSQNGMMPDILLPEVYIDYLDRNNIISAKKVEVPDSLKLSIFDKIMYDLKMNKYEKSEIMEFGVNHPMVEVRAIDEMNMKILKELFEQILKEKIEISIGNCG